MPRCGACQQPSLSVHEYCTRRIRDLPILGRPVLLRGQVRRLACGNCGHRAERVSWLGRHARLPRRLAEAVALWCARLPTQHVADLFGLHSGTVRRLEQRSLQAQLDALPRPQPRRLVMDEFALYKRHRYASVVLNAETRRALWIGEGRSREAIRPLFEGLGPAGCARIEAAAMDMNTAFDLEVRQHCPKARVAYDCSMWWPNMAGR
ncbi:ISL3 family transposase ISAeme19 [compost metagenome]